MILLNARVKNSKSNQLENTKILLSVIMKTVGNSFGLGPNVKRSRTSRWSCCRARILRHLTPGSSDSGSYHGLTHLSDDRPIILETHSIIKSIQL